MTYHVKVTIIMTYHDISPYIAICINTMSYERGFFLDWEFCNLGNLQTFLCQDLSIKSYMKFLGPSVATGEHFHNQLLLEMIYVGSIHAQSMLNPCSIHAIVQSKTKKC